MADDGLRITVFTSAEKITLTLDPEAAWQTIESARDERAPLRSAPETLDRQLLATELPSILVQQAQRQGVLSVLGNDGTSWAIPASALLGVRVESTTSRPVTPGIGFRVVD